MGHGPSSPLRETMVGNGVESGRSGWGPRYRSFGMGCAPRIVLERRWLCRRHVGTFHTSSCVWQPLRQFPSERTMSSEAIKSRSRRRGERAMDLGLQGKHAIVTGGSRGIGKAIARELAREGVDVAIVARNKGDLEATARELAAETNRRILPLAADVTSKEQVDRMVAEAAQQLGGLHILVNR